MRSSKPLLGLIIVGILSACSTMKVTSDYDPFANFSGLRTFAWISDIQEKTGDPQIDEPILDTHIREAVEIQLELQGFEKRTVDPPNFLIGYHTAIDRKIEVRTINKVYSDFPGLGWDNFDNRFNIHGEENTETKVFEFDEGTLILDVVDPETKQLIWRGSAKAEIKYADNPEKRMERIKEAIRLILKNFPPR